jgi:two-component system phosphate regulon sensor histidine kinase PhoR
VTRRGARHRPPTTVFLHRARITFMLAALVPTVLITAIGIILVVSGGSKSLSIVGGILVLAFCATALAGYTMGSIFVTRGANLASIQNEFLSSVSHEIRTPLTSILMFIETLRADRIESPAERQRCLTIVHQELTRLDGLVGKLIELSKIESHPTAFERHPVRVADFVGDALTAFEAMKIGGEAEVADVRADLDPDLLVLGDRSALAQALGNLLSNAWKYTRPHDKKIEVRARADRETISISVSDNGVGIPRLEQAAIFEKFERGSGAVAGGAAGSGLGLAIVRAVVEAHRGRVEVRSQVDHGARFCIVLPRYRAAT